MTNAADRALMGKYLDGIASADEKRRLAERLDDSPELRVELTEWLYYETALASVLAPHGQTARTTGRPGSFRLRWGVALSLAASLMLAVALSVLMRARHPATPLQWATATELQGEASGRLGTAIRPLVAETVLQPGESVATGPDSMLELMLAVGGRMIADRNSEFRSPDAGLDMRLDRGRFLFDIPTVRPGQPGLTLSVADGPSLSVLGTRFEVGADAGLLSLRVEQGRVRVHAPDGSVDVGPLRKLEARADGIVSGPNPIMLSEIARWHYGQDQVAPGTVLFLDSFEDGLDRWDPIHGDWRIVAGRGFKGSSGLVLKRSDAGAEDLSRKIIAPKFIPRYDSYEVSWLLSPSEAVKNYGIMFYGDAEAAEPLETHRLDSYGSPVIRSGQGMNLRLVIQGNRGDWYANSQKTHAMRIPEAYARIALFVVDQGRHDIVIDNVRIVAHAPLPSLTDAASRRILFEDDFEADLSRWHVLDSGADLVDGGGISGGRALRLAPKAGTDASLVVYPKLAQFASNIEVEFDVYILHSKDRAPPVGFGIVMKLPPGIPSPVLPPMDPIELPRNRWFKARTVFQGTDYVFEILDNGKSVGHQAFYLRSPGIVPGINLQTADPSVSLLVDNFRIWARGPE